MPIVKKTGDEVAFIRGVETELSAATTAFRKQLEVYGDSTQKLHQILSNAATQFRIVGEQITELDTENIRLKKEVLQHMKNKEIEEVTAKGKLAAQKKNELDKITQYIRRNAMDKFQNSLIQFKMVLINPFESYLAQVVTVIQRIDAVLPKKLSKDTLILISLCRKKP